MSGKGVRWRCLFLKPRTGFTLEIDKENGILTCLALFSLISGVEHSREGSNIFIKPDQEKKKHIRWIPMFYATSRRDAYFIIII